MTDDDAHVHARRWLLGLAALLLLLTWWSLPRTIQAGDAGEFATVMLRGGVPHPSGYPWMRALGLLARPLWALGLPPATAAALPCALAAMAGWLLLARSCMRLVAPALACGTVALVASAHVVVVHTDDSEVFGPLVLAAAILIELALDRRRHALVVGLAIGVAVSHHLTAVWLVPLAVAAAWPREPGMPALLRQGAWGLLGSAIGLGSFVTLAIGDGPWCWGDTRSVAGLLAHVTRRDYGTFSLSLHDAAPSVSASLGRAGSSWIDAWSSGTSTSPWLAAIATLAIALGAARAWPRAERNTAIALAVAWLLAGPGFVLLQDIDPSSPFAAWILERFDILPLVLATPPFAVALGALAARVPVGWPRRLAAITLATLVTRQLLGTIERGVPADDDGVQRYAVDLLRTPEPGTPALVLGTDDHRTFPVLFAHEILGEGPEVIYVDASLLAHPWYRARLRTAMPALPDVDKPVRMLTALWQEPAGAATPVYLANDFSTPSTTLPRVPEGVLWRVLPPQALATTPELVLERHLRARARLSGPPAAVHSPFAADLAHAWGDVEGQLDAALRRGGRADLAARLTPE